MLDPAHHELLAQVAALYFEQNLTQTQIADRLGLSRVKVYRLLTEARDAGVVRIEIDWPIQRDAELEGRLRERFSLPEALVLKTGLTDPAGTLAQLGQLTATLLDARLVPGSTLALCPGRSTHAVVQAIKPNIAANVRVVQAIGNMPDALLEYDAAALARGLAQKLGGDVVYLSSPLVADTVEAAGVLRAQRDIARALEAARRADLALVGIGDLDPQRSGFVRTGLLRAEELATLREDGAAGDIAWRIFDRGGQQHGCDFNQRVIGLSLDDLAGIRAVIAVAAGARKAGAIRAALHAGALHALATDDRTAAGILAAG
jgi:DNA-binding transcriptional regulator LsrR (DeoR family)